MVAAKMSHSYFRILLCVAAIVLTSEACPDEFELLNGGCYYFSEAQLGWYQSFKACNDLSAHLVTVEDQTENEALKNYLSIDLNSTKSYWMGLTDDHQEGTFIWVNKMVQANYLDWGSQDPNNVNGENCVAFAHKEDFLWQDASCDDIYSFNYICQTPDK